MQVSREGGGRARAGLADLIDELLDSIVQRWIRRVRAAARHNPNLPDAILIDHIPDFLRDVAVSLRRLAAVSAAARASFDDSSQLLALASQHGEQRYAVGADIRAVVHEYELLRAVVFEIVDEAGRDVSVEELGLFGHAISTGIGEAVDRFAKSRERALRESELRFQRLSESGVVGTLEWEASGAITAANATLLEMLGYASEDLAAGALDFKRLTPPEHLEATEQALRTLHTTGVLRALESQFFRKDKGRVTALVSGATMDDDHQRAIGLAVDTTEQKAIEREQARHARFDRELLAIVSHDLRNPLSAILLASTALLKQEDLDPRVTDWVRRIHGSAKRAEGLIEDLLDLTRTRIGRGIPVQLVNVCFHSVVRKVVAEAQLGHPERRVELATEGDDEGEWDPGRVGQVVANLVGNALQHSPPESAVRVRSRGTEAEVCLEVHNDGPPIPEELQSKLFQPFQRGHGTKPGLGLGLYIAGSLVEAHGGTIDVRSREGEGTTFTVRLPRSAQSPQGARPR